MRSCLLETGCCSLIIARCLLVLACACWLCWVLALANSRWLWLLVVGYAGCLQLLTDSASCFGREWVTVVADRNLAGSGGLPDT
jgi:hypothetical protein